AVGIDVDLQAQAARDAPTLEPRPERARQVDLRCGDRQEALAVAATLERDWRRRGAEHAQARHIRRAARERRGERPGLARVAPGDDQGGEPAERRQAGALSLRQLLGVEALLVAGGERLHHRML